jgi:hypothetical protein
VDLINVDSQGTKASNQAIISITDDTRSFSQITIPTDNKIDSIAAAIWHHWCLPYGMPEMILANQGKVWTSKLESRINNFMPLETKISCRSEREIFNQEIRQQWQQSQQDMSAEEFAQNWNFLCNLQGPAKSKSGYDRINGINDNLEDVEDFVEQDTDIEDHNFGIRGQDKHLQRKQVRLCRHKLQRQAYPKVKRNNTVLTQPERLQPLEDPELDHEWLQLIQMEKTIANQKHQLLKTGVKDYWGPDEDRENFWEDEESPADERADHLDDGDLEYINAMLNSFSRQNGNHENSNHIKLESFPPEDALTRVHAPRRMPQEFNLKFNQNSTTRGSETNHFSCLSNVEDEGPTELEDYFSDDEEEDSWDEEDLTSEGNLWSHTNFNNPEENLTHSQPTLFELDPVISGLETIDEARFEDDIEANKLNHISGLSEETKLAFSTWRLFIPHEHAFRNCAAQSQLSDFSSQASLLQEPTLIQISAISASMEQTSSPTEPTSP